MGCDIHGWVEVKVGDKWVAIRELADCSRNYERFAALAGVRGEGPTPKGLPEDVSDTARYDRKMWGGDGHSASYLSIEEAGQIFVETCYMPDDYQRKHSLSAFFDTEPEEVNGEDLRLVFWFDN